MRRALTIILGVVLVCLVAYLSWLNPTLVDFRFTTTRTVHAPLSVLIVFAFVVGALVVLTVVTVQAGQRAFAAWRLARQQRRAERIDAWEKTGEELIWKGDAQQGRSLLHRAWRRSPGSSHAVLALASSYCETGEVQRAKQVLSEAAHQQHTDPAVILALAEVQRRAGDHAGCVVSLERLRALYPHAPRVLNALRDRYVEVHRWADAVSVQEVLLQELRNPEQAAKEREYLLALRYQTCIGIADPHDRSQALEALADGRSASIPVWVSFGDALLQSGRTAEASVLWERALRSMPRTVLVERLAAIATEGGHRERIRAELRKLQPGKVHADHVRLLTAQLYLADGDLDGATRELESVQDPAHAPPLLHRLWADVHCRRGQLDQAVRAYSSADGGGPVYHCITCQHRVREWVGLCPQCGSWDSYRFDVEIGRE
jgi:predicted Zn-dependent protease/uncharacterized integral membrane protein